MKNEKLIEIIVEKENELRNRIVMEVMDYVDDINKTVPRLHVLAVCEYYKEFLEGLSYAFDELDNEQIEDIIHYFKGHFEWRSYKSIFEEML